MNIHWGILGCIFLFEFRVCKGPCRDVSCNTGLCSHLHRLHRYFSNVQRMEEVEYGRPWYLRSWEDIPRDCLSQRFGLEPSVQTRFLGNPRAASASQPELAAGWVGAFWPTMDEEPVPKETTEITSSSQHKSHKSHPSHPSSHSLSSLNPFHLIHHIQPFRWDDTAHHCCSVNPIGMTHIACFPPAPSAVHVAGLQRYGRRGILEISMAMILLVWWIRSVSPFFSEISIEKSWLVSEALVCPIFSKQILWIGWKVTAMESFWICWRHFGMSSFILHLASPW